MLSLLSSCAAEPEIPDAQRHDLVAALDLRGIDDASVLAAMGKVPRHRFVSAKYADLAYTDQPLPIGYGQTISQPYVVAFMTEALDVSPGQKVLEVGTGSGYQAAVLAELGAEVYSIEIVEPIALTGKINLKDTGYERVRLRVGDGYLGWPEAAPFDRIIVTAAPDHVPEPLREQLAVGGRMVIPVGDQEQELRVIENTAEGWTEESVLPVRFVPLTR